MNNIFTRFSQSPMQRMKSQQSPMEIFSTKISAISGSSRAFILAVSIVMIRGITGPIFNYSTTWQLVINTGTTIITFLMVFLIQRSANKSSLAPQLKLNELIACNKEASNRVIDVESLSEEELNVMHSFYEKLAIMAQQEKNIHVNFSIDKANSNHKQKNTMNEKNLLEDVL